jgi:CHASE2 domain-containing sensor protein
MPDMMQDILVLANFLLAISIVSLAVCIRRHERRTRYLWLWLSLAFVGSIWSLLYGFDILAIFVPYIPSIMGFGIIRSAITLTLGVIVAIMLQLRIPRSK